MKELLNEVNELQDITHYVDSSEGRLYCRRMPDGEFGYYAGGQLVKLANLTLLTSIRELPKINLDFKTLNKVEPARNRGGSTDYYAVPKEAKTLNDLIEFKKMNPNLHEIFKATYAIDERSNRNIEGQDRLRELNKIKYYVEREIRLELNKEKR